MHQNSWPLSRQFGFRIDFLESGIQLKESIIPLTFGIQNASSTDFLGFGIHRVNSRIQDSLGLP